MRVVMALMVAPVAYVFAQGYPGRCVADCQALTTQMDAPCSEFKTGKPFKACGWSHREGVKDACRQLCRGADRRELIARVDKACNNARQAIPKPAMHKACVTGYQGAFNLVSSVNDDQLRKLIDGTPIEEVSAPQVEEQRLVVEQAGEAKQETREMPPLPLVHRQEKIEENTIEVMGKRIELKETKLAEPEVPKAKPVEELKAAAAETIKQQPKEERKLQANVPKDDVARAVPAAAATTATRVEKKAIRKADAEANKEKKLAAAAEDASVRAAEEADKVQRHETQAAAAATAAAARGHRHAVHEPQRDLKADAAAAAATAAHKDSL